MKTVEYKDSEVGRIPSDWTVKQIGKIGYTYSGLTGKVKDDFGKGDARYITFLNVLNNPILKTDIFEKVDVTEVEHQNKAMKGDLFFNTSSETPEEVGICSLLDEDVPNLYLNSFCFGYRLTDPDVDGLYLSYFFRSKQGRDNMSTLAQGATRYNLSKEYFNKTLIAFPPLSHQKKIAKSLSEIDALIAKQDDAIEKKQLIKEGLMQDLLTGKKRIDGFDGEWISIALGAISDIRTGKRNGDEQLENGKYPFFVRSQIVYRIDSYSYDGEAILVPGEGGIGKIFHYINGKFDYHQRVYKISDFPKNYCVKYIYYYLCRYFGPYAMQNTVKATVDSLRLPMFLDFNIHLPASKEEQCAIAKILDAVAFDIQVYESQREKYLLVKQGMMQELLTGKTRLI